VKDIRAALVKLGENPHDKFYEQVMERKKKIEKKSGLFGKFASGQKN
jgi:hypothetical protein